VLQALVVAWAVGLKPGENLYEVAQGELDKLVVGLI